MNTPNDEETLNEKDFKKGLAALSKELKSVARNHAQHFVDLLTLLKEASDALESLGAKIDEVGGEGTFDITQKVRDLVLAPFNMEKLLYFAYMPPLTDEKEVQAFANAHLLLHMSWRIFFRTLEKRPGMPSAPIEKAQAAEGKLIDALAMFFQNEGPKQYTPAHNDAWEAFEGAFNEICTELAK